MRIKRFRPLHSSRASYLFVLLVIVSIIATQILPYDTGIQAKSAVLGPATLTQPSEVIFMEEEGTAGLQIVLSEGAEQPSQAETIPIAAAEPLPASDAQQILERLPPLPVEETDQQAFNLPEQSLPPPQTGSVIEEPFPPVETVSAPSEVESAQLEVLRYAPEGDIPVAPFLNVTFSQPMVPLATLEQLSAQDVPVTLTPELPGSWKWIGTKTLTFEYDSDAFVRFPMATEYVAVVPAGTRSAIDGVLAEEVTWTFRTPPPQLTFTEPGYGPQPRHPLMFAAFNQRINPAAVLETVRVTAGGTNFPVHLATESEIQADKRVSQLTARAGEDRWLAFRAAEEFPANTTVVVNLGPGTPSAEGPLTTKDVQSFSFQTYAPLRVDSHRCSYYGDDECPPLVPFEIIFNNPLDESMFEDSLLTVDPEIPGLVIENYGNTIRISGATKGRTTYNVTVDKSIQDIFGQTLGQTQTLKFKTSSAPRALVGPTGNFITLDPSSHQPVFTVYSINYEQLRIRAYAVTPKDWTAYLEYMRTTDYNDRDAEPPGERVLSQTITVSGAPDELTETSIDLSDALNGDTGHLIVIVDSPAGLLFNRRDRNYDRVQSWVQVTQIGLDAFVDHSEMHAWATSLQDGTPLSGIDLQLDTTGTSAVTNDDGTARLELTSTPASTLIARKGADIAFLPMNTYYWYSDGWHKVNVQDEVRWYVFDDRQMYRPGEEVHLKGWIRRVGGRQDGDLSLLSGATAVSYRVMGPQGNQFHEGMLDVNDLGGFDLAFTLPDNANLGYASLILTVPGIGNAYGADYYHSFQIQEFRRPEFSVSARSESKGPYFVGDEAVVAVTAQYFAGGSLPNAETTWSVSSSPGSYSPPNWPDFIFGQWIPWWVYRDSGFYGAASQTFSGKTDASGTHYLSMDFASASQPRPYSVMAEAVVMDVNRQAWAANTNMLVHPAELYVGIRSDRTFVDAGEPLKIDAIVTDLDGNPVEDRLISMRAVRTQWKYAKGSWNEEEVDPQECRLASELEPTTCTFSTDLGGQYRITAIIEDSRGRTNRSEFTRWVSGGQRPPSRDVEQEELTLIPDREHYQPGDVAEILVQTPFTPAEGLLTLSRSGIVSTERFSMTESTHVLKIPVYDQYIPNLHVTVDLVGAAARTDDQGEAAGDLPKRPAYASGTLNLSIPPLNRELTVAITPEATELEPGAETSIDVVVSDAAGQPVQGAELAVVIVDEAILALTNYQLADPLGVFYQERGSDVGSFYSRANIVLASPQALATELAANVEESALQMRAMATATSDMAAPAAAPAEGAVFEAEMAMDDVAKAANAPGDEPASPIAIRTNFNPLAAFAPSVRTDGSGTAKVDVSIPDNLTRYRVMVVAVAGGKQFGSAESNLTARLPLMVRPSAPRFLNFGDRFELPVVLQNQTNEPIVVDVATRATNLDLSDVQGWRLEVPANDRREVRFPASTVSAGTARLQIAAVAGRYADAASVTLPVYTPATTEAFATYGVIDEGAITQPIATPTNVFPQFGGLEINTSSTALQALTDAVVYLVQYPFECSEQLASRILGVAALRDVLSAFQAEGLPSPEAIELAMVRDIERLQQLQNWDGGFPIWTKGRESVPFYSIHVTHALQRARLKGYEVPDDMMQRALDHLRNIESYYPYWYGESTRHALSAYALYVRDLMSDTDTAKARSLLNERPLERQSLEAIAWIWQVLSDDPSSAQEVEKIQRHINNRAVETAGAANFTTSYGDDAYLMLHSDRRTDAVVLDAMINDQPDSDLIPKIVNGLLAHRTAGLWRNTQENVFVLLALDRYFNTFESITPDFVARMWLSDTYIAAHAHAGRTTEQRQTLLPMSYLTDTTANVQDLVIGKEGDGRLYYRLGLRYAPDDLYLDPLEMGFVVQRSYEAVDDPDDVWLDDSGVWHIKAGARVRIRLTMVANNRRYHVALVDPLPAGLESINPALAVAESVPGDPNIQSAYGWWWGTWYQHQNLRDQRAEAFTPLLWEGVYNYTYVARATTPGEYVVPPAKAEEMYSPEVFGRSSSDTVIVE